MTKVWIYQCGDVVRVFATMGAALEWFSENDPEGVAFEHEVTKAKAEEQAS